MEKKTTIPCSADSREHQLILDVQQDLPGEQSIENLGNLFKVFGDPTRLRILYSLMERELCVYHIAQSLDMSQSAISHQLRVLRENHLVKSRREGKQVIYSLDDHHVLSIIQQGRDHIDHIQADKQKKKETEK